MHWIGQAATLPAMIEWALKSEGGDGSGTPKKIQLNGVVCGKRVVSVLKNKTPWNKRGVLFFKDTKKTQSSLRF